MFETVQSCLEDSFQQNSEIILLQDRTLQSPTDVEVCMFLIAERFEETNEFSNWLAMHGFKVSIVENTAPKSATFKAIWMTANVTNERFLTLFPGLVGFEQKISSGRSMSLKFTYKNQTTIQSVTLGSNIN